MSNIRQLFEKASKFYQKGRLQDADRYYSKIVSQQPGSTEALNMRGIIQAQTGNFEQAIKYFARVLRLEPGHKAATENIGRAFMQLGQAERATVYFEQALKTSPRSYMSLFGQGCALMALNRLDESLASFNKAQQIDPRQALLHMNKGTVLSQMGEMDAAITSYNQALALNRNLPQVHARLGHVYLQTKRYELAESQLRKARESGINDLDTELDFAEALEFNNKQDQAYQQYQTTAGKHPSSQNAYTRFDQFLLRSGSKEKKQFLKHIGTDHIYKEWSEAVDVARKLTGFFHYHNQSATEALEDFLNNYEPGKLHDRSWWQQQLATFGDSGSGHDKLLRSVHSAIFCWSLPDSDTLGKIAQFAGNTRLYSYGAGTGVWERLLIEHFNLAVVATEFTLRHRFLPMQLEDYSTATVNSDDTIFLSWIVRGDTNILNIFKQMRLGQKLVLVGEPPDEEGIPRICATPDIFALLDAEYSLEESIPLVSYSLLNDTVSLYIKK